MMDNAHTAKAVVGACTEMCPDEEFEFRRKHNLLHKLEGRKRENCIKEFHRSAAGQIVCQPSNLRPGPILLKTVDHLFRKLHPEFHITFAEAFDFIFDRLRSVRQDAVVQQLLEVQPFTYASILESCCRFYLYGLYFATYHPGLPFEIYIIKQHLQNCLKSLFDLYCQVHFEFGDKQGLRSCACMLSAHLLLNIHETDSLVAVLCIAPPTLRRSEPLRTCIAICLAVMHRNYVRCGRLATRLCAEQHLLPLCALSLSLERLRCDTVRLLSCSHHSKAGTFLSSHLADWLLMTSGADAAKYCAHCGMQVKDSTVRFCKADFKVSIGPATGCVIFDAINEATKGEQLINFLSGET